MKVPLRRCAVLAVVSLLLQRGVAVAQTRATITLAVDLSEAPRHILHAREVIPAEPGPLTLYYPKWIPGEHAPDGPVADLAGVRFSAAGEPLGWQRDPLDMYAFLVNVPPGAREMEVTLDYLVPEDGGRYSAGASTTSSLAVLSWNTVLLYPKGRPASTWTFDASIHLPAGWKFATALPVASQDGGDVSFAPVPLTTLIDSPVATGEHLRVLPLGGAVPHEIDLVGDDPAALELTPAALAAYRRLVAEALALFGGYHYRDYHFLFTVSDHVQSFGLEHHESSDDRVPERTLRDPDVFEARAGLLPHEFVHSWNGKYRRPTGLATADYQQPMEDDLLWVYEGLTSYLGEVLTARSGLWSQDTAREALALLAAGLDNRPGRSWRPLSDTARAASILYGTRPEWSAWRRGVDFYDEGVLVWLEADTTIRRLTKGTRSLDDFCRLFHGGSSGPPKLEPYTLDDVVAALNRVAPYDWRRFFSDRINSIAPSAPLDGITGGGWKLVYDARPNSHLGALERAGRFVDLRFSLGCGVQQPEREGEEGLITDVIPGMPAAVAGLAPGMRLIAVNGRRWSPERLREALHDAQASGAPIELIAESGEFVHTFRIAYRGGERYPHLERRPGTPDLLGAILQPRTPPP